MLIFYGNGIGLLNLDNVIKFETSPAQVEDKIAVHALCVDGSKILLDKYRTLEDAKIELEGIFNKFEHGKPTYRIGNLKAPGSKPSDLTSLFK